MKICIRRNVCISITLDYMKNTNILIHECVNISVFQWHVFLCTLADAGVCVCVRSGTNIHVHIHMYMVMGLPRSINVNIGISISSSFNRSISISILHILI